MCVNIMLLKVDHVDKWGVNGVCKNFVKNYLIFIQIYIQICLFIFSNFSGLKFFAQDNIDIGARNIRLICKGAIQNYVIN